MGMVKFDEGERFTIAQVLNHPFFEGLTKSPIELLATNYQPVVGKKLDKIGQEIRKILYPAQHRSNLIRPEVDHIHQLSLDTYLRILDLVPSNLSVTRHNIYMVAACWIGSKIVLGVPPRIQSSFRTFQILKCEQEV